MSNITAVSRPTATLAVPTTATLFNITTVAATESSQLLGPSAQRIFIKCRGTARLQYAFISGDSGGPGSFMTVPRGTERIIDLINFSGTIYFQTSEADVVEIETWA